MHDHRIATTSDDGQHPRAVLRSYWLLALGSLFWLLLRSGANPRRLAYPCQRAALANSMAALGFVTATGSAGFDRLNPSHLTQRLKQLPAWPGTGWRIGFRHRLQVV